MDKLREVIGGCRSGAGDSVDLARFAAVQDKVGRLVKEAASQAGIQFKPVMQLLHKYRVTGVVMDKPLLT